VSTALTFAEAGKHFGHLRVPQSTNTSGWGGLWISCGYVVNGDGPTVLVLGGNHGDEYEGQITALNLLRDIDPSGVRGRLIVIPCLSPQASRAGTRLWPSGANFNRSFPGSPTADSAGQLADYLTRVLFPMADVVIDLHSGGHSGVFYPMSHMHLVPDLEQRAAMARGMFAFNTDFHLLYIDVAGAGLLPNEAERQGKIVITTELGGGGYPTKATLRIGREGLRNALRSVGLIDEPVLTRADLGLDDPIVLSALDPADYISADESGLYETLVAPGDPVQGGQVVGQVHFLERPERAPLAVESPVAGYAAQVRARPQINQGDCVLVVGQPVDAASLLSGS
jgi:N-alpha-acetyl-L-2,4-diaminobutyrate deacetylase